jgi:glycosyltransferase involved in cell wall biosynthesis
LEIVEKEKIDILHQLNMIGFREPGYLWMIHSIPFVWGPVGGLKQFPITYLQDAGYKINLFNRLKNFINILQIKYDKRVEKTLHHADLLISSIPDSYNAIRKYHKLESIIIPETGCYIQNSFENDITRFDKTIFDLMWVGKFDFRKQLEIALRTIARVKHLEGLKLHVYGTGTVKQVTYYKQLAINLNINDQIEWNDNKSNHLVLKQMKNAHLFFFTSVSDDTSTVVLEALSSCLPILCFDTCGFGYIVNDLIGRKVKLSNPAQSVLDFAKQIDYLYHNREKLKELSLNCAQRQQELSWENKAKQMLELYKQAIEK